jgi:hypothetical protein
MPNIAGLKHPTYIENEEDFTKWRLTYIGGTKYKEEYLTQREGEDDFNSRLAISYVPGYAKEAVLEISRAIHQRLPRVSRSSGSGTYLQTAQGLNGGVDRMGSPMNAFISRKIVDELCFMGAVGCYVDNTPIIGPTKADLRNTDHPYFYSYKREDILDWAFDPASPTEFIYVILREYVEKFDIDGFRTASEARYRHVYKKDGKVFVAFYAASGSMVDQLGQPTESPIPLDLPIIPFAMADLGMSLLQDVADHQIALMVLASLDMSYAVKSNVPFYTEQRNALNSDTFTRLYNKLPRDSAGNPVNPEDLTDDQRKKFLASQDKLVIGATKGRFYGKDFDRPGFIHPSSEPLRASMDKQMQIREEIRELVALNVQKVGLRFQSEEAKKMDTKPLEAGLSFIGLSLQSFETSLANIYAAYEAATPAMVRYPEQYSLLSETERRQAIKEDRELMSSVPSQTFRIEMQKTIVETRFSHILDPTLVAQMKAEIEKMSAPTADPDEILADVEGGLCSAEYGSLVRGYPAGEAAKAQAEKAQRLNIATRLQEGAQDNPDERDPDATKSQKLVLREAGKGKK